MFTGADIAVRRQHVIEVSKVRETYTGVPHGRGHTRGARAIEGPGLHPEYGEYYAVFFEDADGNRFEIVAA